MLCQFSILLPRNPSRRNDVIRMLRLSRQETLFRLSFSSAQLPMQAAAHYRPLDDDPHEAFLAMAGAAAVEEDEDASLRSLSMERFSDDDGRNRRGVAAVVSALAGDCWWRHEAEICLHRCADMV